MLKFCHPAILAAAFALYGVSAAAQQRIAFDVASIKESKSFDAGGFLRLMPGGGITAQHFPARSLVTMAYQIQKYQLLGAPEWTTTAYYDVIAKPAQATTRDQIFPMLRSLLQERFKLSVHREDRAVNGYVLVRAGGLGPGLTVSSSDCEKAFLATPMCRQNAVTRNMMRGVGLPMWSVLQTIISAVGAPVSDETGLTATYDVDLRWSPDVAASDDLQSIFTALPEQLGLKLEKRRVTTQVVVVDHIERPSPD